MALTELQLPTKAELYQNLKTVANEIRRSLERWDAASDWIASVTVADLDALGVPTGQVRTDLADLRQLLTELSSLFNNETVTPAKDPKEVTDRIRQMLVI